jgi:hypothetical protein
VQYFLVVFLVLIPASALAQAVDSEAPPRPPGAVLPSTATPAISRDGVTFEANLGLGLVWARSSSESSDTQTGLGGLNLGLGGWLSDSLALSARIAGVTFSPVDGVRFSTGFVGLSLQKWSEAHFWVGGGAGFAFAAAHIDGAASQPEPDTGFALDLRVGYTFNPDSQNTFNISAELTPGFFSVAREAGTRLDVEIYSLGLLLGYQHL